VRKKEMAVVLVGASVLLCGIGCLRPSTGAPAPVIAVPFTASMATSSPAAPLGVAEDGPAATSTAEAASAQAPASQGTTAPGVLTEAQRSHHAEVARLVGEANHACGTVIQVACGGDVCAYVGPPFSPLQNMVRRPQIVLEKALVGVLGLSPEFDACGLAARRLEGPGATMPGYAYKGVACSVRTPQPVDYKVLSQAEGKAHRALEREACQAAAAAIGS
jgi:hypothetical protein